MHISLRALDVVMKVVAEELYMRDSGGGNFGMGEMTREENKGDVSDVFGVSETGDVTDLEWRITIGIQNLGSVLNGGLSPCVHKFLQRG